MTIYRRRQGSSASRNGDTGSVASRGHHRVVLHLQCPAAGYPSVRSIARATDISHTRVYDYLRGAGGAATWERIRALALHLGGDEAEVRRLWDQARTDTTANRQMLGGAVGVATTATLLGEILHELRALRQELAEERARVRGE